jgi:NDP-sugar pyrophosphorylase family protein
VLLLNGDSWVDIDLSDFGDTHHRCRARASLVLAHVADAARYGKVETDSKGRVVCFEEKQPDRGDGWINGGIYLLDRRLIEAIPTGRSMSLEREKLPAWVRHPGLHGFRCGGPFLDIGTPESYARAEAFLMGCGMGRRPPAARMAASWY